jgi:AcrR family transcriptional regulator
MCNHVNVQTNSARARAMDETRTRILDVALDVLGQNPDSRMGDIASAAGVVRRTVYGYFPTRTDLVRTLAQRAVEEMTAVLTEVVNAADGPPDTAWVDFIGRLWPVADRYRVLLALRRGEYGEEIHALLRPVDDILAELVRTGQDSDVFGRHLPAHVLSQIALAAVFAIADTNRTGEELGAWAAAMTSLLVLGVPEARATALVDAKS